MKTVKTAGTSVECYFEQYAMPSGQYSFSESREEMVSNSGIIGYRGTDVNGKKFYNHMSAEKIRSIIEPQIWDEYFKFTVIRNPFHKIVSMYFMANKGSNKLSEIKQVQGFRDWLDFNSLIKDSVALHVFDSDKYILNNNVCMDGFIRYESLLYDISIICNRLGIEWRPNDLRNLKGLSSPNINIHNFYDDFSMKKILKWFDFEFEYFNYKRTL